MTLAENYLQRKTVAPLAGAWIEIYIKIHLAPNDCSSLPSRERGLKYIPVIDSNHLPYVAPLAGAWIEIIWLCCENVI